MRLREYIKENLKVWKKYLKFYNYYLLKPIASHTSSTLLMFTDSSKMGYGGIFNRDFIHGSFSPSWQELDIQVLEFSPIFLLVHMFANDLKSSRVLFHCENTAVVSALNKQISRNKSVMKLLRPLILTSLKFNIRLSAEHPRHEKYFMWSHFSFSNYYQAASRVRHESPAIASTATSPPPQFSSPAVELFLSSYRPSTLVNYQTAWMRVCSFAKSH